MNQNPAEKKFTALVASEQGLEFIISELLARSVARTDISVQGSPEQIRNKYQVSYIDPGVMQSSSNPPMTEPFLNDDFGWVQGFSFALPFILCIIISVFIIGNVRSLHDNLFYGFIGGCIGAFAGYIISSKITKRHNQKIENQEAEGGYLIWVTTHTAEQYQDVMNILVNNHAYNITS